MQTKTNPANPTYTLFFTNFDYASQDVFSTVEAAKLGARRAGFDSVILEDAKYDREARRLVGTPIAYWSILGGFRTVRR